MNDSIQNVQSQSLWDCLHDGSVVSFDSNLMARTLTIAVDSPYHWEFHELPAETRFRIIGENVRIAEAFDFEPWLGAVDPPRETPWEEAQSQRMSDYKKGRLISTDWNAFVADIVTDEDYEIMNAELTNGQPLAVLELGIMSYPDSRYRTVRIQAEGFRFHVGERELSLDEFLEFGEAYWKHFAQRSELGTTLPKSS
jgi:hypothetical protein